MFSASWPSTSRCQRVGPLLSAVSLSIYIHECYLSQYPIANSTPITEMWPVTIVPMGHCTLLTGLNLILELPMGFSVPLGLCSHSVHGQLWILFILGLHPNGPSPCLAKSSPMLWTEKIPIRNDKHDTQIKPVLHPGGSRYYWQFWNIGFGVCSGWPKRQLVKSTPKQISNEGQKKKKGKCSLTSSQIVMRN